MDFSPSDKQEPIAIIGAACRFAGGASSLESLWDMISKVKTGHGAVPGDRWDSNMWYHPDPDRKGGILPQHGYFLEQDVGHFDAPFFSVTEKEAASMDPMKRMLLEVSYESFENAGIPMEHLMNSRTGCYVGCMTNDYEMISLHDIYDIGHPAATGLSEAMTANRVSWFFGLKGPSLTLDTACSSSLYALHLACQSLRLGETNMSLITGVNLLINPNTSHQLTAMHMLSPEGISHTFDDRANGYGRGDGIGAMVIKRLSDALRDGDTIRAVIRGSGVNADGKTPSVTQPSSTAQAELIIQTYEDAGLDLSQTGYFECHGTGTPIGDPLELTAIASTLGAARRAAGKPPLHIGSIKPTVGHTEGCAGLAGVFKSIVLLEKGMLVPTFGVDRINPKLKLADWHLTLPDEVARWPTPGLRRISVNSFGFGGANAHVILDDAYHYLHDRGLEGRHNTVIGDFGSDSGFEDTSVNGADEPGKKLFVLSGKDQTGAKRVSEALHVWLQQDPEDQSDPALLENLAFTLAHHRTHLENRTFVIANSASQLIEKLSKGLVASTRSQRHGSNLVMVFTGQGAQWPVMGLELLVNSTFRSSIETSQTYLEEFGCTWNAIDELSKKTNSNINRPEYSQPLCTVVQVALVDLLRSWEVLPKATIGHSSGEIAAAYAASLLSHYDAIKLAYVRGVSSAAVSKPGAMMAAGISEDEAQEYLAKVPTDSAVVACVNSPSSVTLSGDVDAIAQLETLISGDGKFARKLKVTTAYHSPHMREVSSTYLDMIGELQPKEADGEGEAPVMYSSLTGSIVTSAKELNAQYWVNNMQNPVRFSQALLALLKHKRAAAGGSRPVAIQWGSFLEVGPHAALQGPVRQIIDASNNKFAKSAPSVSMLVRGQDATETALNAAGVLWATGCPIKLAEVNQETSTGSNLPQMLCNLPSYPWNHAKSFWHESYASRSYRFPPHARTDYLGMAEDSQNTLEPRWRNYLRISENPWIEDHIITGTVLYPGAGMLVMALEGALRIADSSKTIEGFRMNDVTFERGLVISLDEETPVETRISFYPDRTRTGSWAFTVYSMTNGSPWAKHCAGTVTVVYDKGASDIEPGGVNALWQQQLATHRALLSETDSVNVDAGAFYKNLGDIGMQYGPSFCNVKSLTAVPSRKASYGSVTVPNTKLTMPRGYETPHLIHPATMDSIFHLVIASLAAGQPVKQAVVPYSIDEIFIAHDQPKEAGTLYSGYGRLLSQIGHEITTELVVADENWTRPRLTVKGFALRQVTSDTGVENLDAISSRRPTRKCADISWIPDLSFVTSSKQLATISSSRNAAGLVASWLDSIFLKEANASVLVILFDQSESSLNVLHRLNSQRYGPKRITAVAASESISQTMKNTLGEGTENLDITYQTLPQSLSVEMLDAEDSDVVLALGVPDLVAHATTLAKLAPLVCLTSTSHRGKVDPIPSERTWLGSLAEDDIYVLCGSRPKSLAVELPDTVVILLPDTTSIALRIFAAELQARLERAGHSVSQTSFTPEGIALLSHKHVISLLEIDSPLVYAWSEDQFNTYKKLISTVGHLFWITHGSVIESWSNGVEFATTQGLFRVMRNEYPIAVLPVLDLSAVADISSPQYADLVLDVWRSSLPDDGETEYAEYNGLIYIPRATEDAGFDYELQLANNTAKPIESTLGTAGQPLVASGLTSDQAFIWTSDDEAQSPLEEGQVEIKIEYSGAALGHASTSVRHAVGAISRLHNSVRALQLGQRVVVFSEAAAKTHVRQNQDLIAPLPNGLAPPDAVALVDPLLQRRLLVDGAGSAVGQALVQVASAVGADIFAMVNRREERDLLTERYGISKDRVFDAGLENFIPVIQATTKGRGLDVVISQRTPSHVPGLMSTLSEFGQFVDLNGENSQALLPGSKTNAFRDYNLQGPSPRTIVPVSKLGSTIGTVLPGHSAVSWDNSSPLLLRPPPAEQLKLDHEATYVLAGGLGALGLHIADWMVECGARNLAFLSRSGGAKNQHDLDRFRERSVQVEAFKCDVNDADNVAKVFGAVKSSGSRIAGVIQLAMVLDDGIFDNMSFDQWRRAIEPKTKGSRNLLANLWPGDKPFFVLLSSITGVIGNTAQANYAAGNTFEDALAHHARHHLGINATSVDVGLVTDSAHFTNAGEFGDLAGYLGRYQHGWRGLQTNLDELGVVLRAIMRGSTTDGQSVPAQIVLGLEDRIEHNPSIGGFSRDKKFELRVVNSASHLSDKSGKQDVGTLLTSATSMAQAVAAVEDNIKTLVAAAMGVSVDEIDAQKPLYDYGVDSLQAVEVRNRALKDMKSDISVFDILSAMPLADVAGKIAAHSQLVKVSASEE
ncbi:Type I Polyketide synthases (Type I PKS) [Penicillium chermesinum]|uniref:Type I Polyketide synthases (Type I PKS) n=1 Tax=Penicillium chermesinum TaxID=63820 RepID=A0A9W9N8C9_9EURO|nr:Type I Polyketide synthases (Type I PKS) [Penicillium chermesinum]KAJ5215071.1 Type I Polyketide synthases (Type I PKS) [Penicillium chermesinum]